MSKFISLAHTVHSSADKPAVGATLIAAGFIPMWINPDSVKLIYFLFLIPPAAYHCWVWFRNTICPVVKKAWRFIKGGFKKKKTY